MPDSLQYSPTGELLQERVEAMDSWAEALRSIVIDDDSEIETILCEIQDADPGV